MDVSDYASALVDAVRDADPLFSVIVPIRERTKYLRQCLESVLRRTENHRIDILVIENPSPTPGIKELVREIAGDKARYHRNERDLGLYGSVNVGVRLTRGRWVHVLHEDDWVLPGFYAAVARAFLELPTCSVVSVGYENVQESDGVNWLPLALTNGAMVCNEILMTRLCLCNPLQVCSVVFSRKAFEVVGHYREDLPHTADWEWWVRAAVKVPWYHVPESLARFRVHDEQDTWRNDQNGRSIVETRRTYETMTELFPDRFRTVLQHGLRHHADKALNNALLQSRGNEFATTLRMAREAVRMLEMSTACCEIYA